MDKGVYMFIIVAVGILTIVASVLNLDFFFNSRKARFFVNIFGRTGARIFYIVLGFAIIIMGLML